MFSKWYIIDIKTDLCIASHQRNVLNNISRNEKEIEKPVHADLSANTPATMAKPRERETYGSCTSTKALEAHSDLTPPPYIYPETAGIERAVLGSSGSTPLSQPVATMEGPRGGLRSEEHGLESRIPTALLPTQDLCVISQELFTLQSQFPPELNTLLMRSG